MSRARAVELAGYLSASVGVGEAARGYVGAMRSVGIGVLAHDVPLPGRDPAGAVVRQGPAPEASAVGANLLCLNPEQMLPFLAGPDAPITAGRSTVGIWSWEVDVLPPGWREAAAGLSEVWTYSRFSAELIGAGVGVPVHSVPPPVTAPRAPAAPPIELPAGFNVLIMFDFLSTLERKNPLGAIAAYRDAFAPGDGVSLIVKSVNGRHRPEQLAAVTAAIAGRPDIVLVDRTMTGPERDALIAACDCFLSLHRSEGHGLPIAEAMACGRIVVATGYGGNTEFMTEENAYPVAWRPARVGPGVEHYPQDATWAEPDRASAVALLREACKDRDRAARRARRAQADLERTLSPAAVGARIAERLRALDAAREARPARPGSRARAALGQVVARAQRVVRP
ncbi:MAG TPA: glycosyltransferase [Solirubrobacteraceae bacterium]|nr:glycosyltransferase [Solirubrobacteraceae bacterium]